MSTCRLRRRCTSRDLVLHLEPLLRCALFVLLVPACTAVPTCNTRVSTHWSWARHDAGGALSSSPTIAAAVHDMDCQGCIIAPTRHQLPSYFP